MTQRWKRVLAGLAGLAVIAGTGALAGATPAAAQEWSDDPPDLLRGSWALNGRCESDTSEMLIFSDGGYRWRKSDGSWGFARGSFSYASPRSSRVLFKVRHIVPTPGYEAVLRISGSSLVKTNLKSNTQRNYRRCED